MTPIIVEIYPIPIAEFRQRIIDLYRPPLRAPGTFGQMRRALDLLAELGGIETTADLNTAAIARFVAWRAGKESPNTTANHLKCLASALAIAAAECWVRVSPFAVRRRWVRRVTPRAPRVHSREEIARILATARDEAIAARGTDRFKARRLQALTATAAYTGMRRTELLTLRAEDVDLAAGMIFLRARADGQLKTEAAAQPVPVPDALAAILGPWLDYLALTGALADDRPSRSPATSWLNVQGRKPPGAPTVGRTPGPIPPLPARYHAGNARGWMFPTQGRTRPWTGGSAGGRALDAMQALGERAGVPGVTFQSFRHSWASHAEFWGFSETLIQRVLRHTNTRTQQRYRHAELNNLRERVAGIDFAAPTAEGGAR